MSEAEDTELAAAASRIQATFRGRKAREEIHGSGQTAITVGLRLRPFVPADLIMAPVTRASGSPRKTIVADSARRFAFRVAGSVVSVDKDVVELLDPKLAGQGPWKFDVVMDSSDPSSPSCVDNARCYKLMGQRMMEDVRKGFNTCLFCYGQTGTGKTTTIMGDESAGPGLLRKLLDDIFLEATKMRAGGAEVSIEISMLEVYNEELRDLLVERGASKQKVDTRVLPTGVKILGAVEKKVETADECQALIDFGNNNKTMAATAMNPQSSRGHTVFRLTLNKSGSSDDARSLRSEVYFADLAGHEDIKSTQVTGDRLKELSFINSSLMWLQNALHSMADMSTKPSKKIDFSKFRNSKLTLLLSNALTGNSHTAVIVTLSPSITHFETTLGSIKFAMEVKGIKVKATSSATEDPQAVIKNLRQEVEQLKAQLQMGTGGQQLVGGPGKQQHVDGPRAMIRDSDAKELHAQVLELRDKAAQADELTKQVSDLRTKLVAATLRTKKDPHAEKLRAENLELREKVALLETERKLWAPRPTSSCGGPGVDDQAIGSSSERIPLDMFEQVRRALALSKCNLEHLSQLSKN